jgi:adenosylhomocysteine nucleosidase
VDASGGMAFDGGPLTAIVAAMQEEVGALRARLHGITRAPAVSGVDVTCGWLGQVPVVLAVTGDGESNARRGLAALLAALPLRRVIVAGVSGGLNATLGAGALVVGQQVVNEADGSVQVGDPTLIDACASACAAQRGVIVTATRIADTADEKRRLRALAMATMPTMTTTAAPSDGPAVVDLESAAYVGAAARVGLPWLVLRAVSDLASESLPALLNQSRDQGGGIRRGRVVRALLTNPRALLPLLAMRERVRACAGELGRAVELTVAALRLGDASEPAIKRPAPRATTTAAPREVH